MQIYLGDNILIPLQLSFGETNQYPQVLIYDSAGTLLSTNNMTHKATGFYYYDYTPASADYYTLIFKVWTDAGHSVLSTTYGLLSDTLEVINNLETKIDTIDGIVDNILLKVINTLGLSQQNYRISSPVYDANNNLTSCTIKIYPTNTDTDNDTNVINTYTLTATYNANSELLTYKVVEA